MCWDICQLIDKIIKFESPVDTQEPIRLVTVLNLEDLDFSNTERWVSK